MTLPICKRCHRLRPTNTTGYCGSCADTLNGLGQRRRVKSPQERPEPEPQHEPEVGAAPDLELEAPEPEPKPELEGAKTDPAPPALEGHATETEPVANGDEEGVVA